MIETYEIKASLLKNITICVNVSTGTIMVKGPNHKDCVENEFKKLKPYFENKEPEPQKKETQTKKEQ